MLAEPICSVELVYFDIHARGELTRLCYAAAGRSSELVDTRIPLFMESEEAAQEWRDVHRRKTPFGYVPYLNVVTEEERPANSNSTATQVKRRRTRQISGDGVVETFAARQLGLLGNGPVDEAVCATISSKAVSLLGPQLTRAGLTGQETAIEADVRPDSPIGDIFSGLERYVRGLQGIVDLSKDLSADRPFYIVADRLTLADLAIFNALDECLKGPRSQLHFKTVEKRLRQEFPVLMRCYDQVENDLKVYIEERQTKFSEKPKSEL